MKKQYVNAFMDQKGIAYFGDKWDDIWDAEEAWLDELDRLSTTALVGDVQWMGVWTLRIPEEESR